MVARSKLSRYVSDLKQASATEKAGALIKTGYLASVKTGERITGSNIVQGLADMSVRNIVAAADYVQALVRSAAKGGRVKPYEMRNIASTLNLPGFKATAKGFVEGLSHAKTIMETGINPGVLDQRIQGSAFGTNQTHFNNPILDKVTRTIGNYIAAIHQPFYNVAFRVSMYGRSRLAGIQAGLTGKALTEFINQQMANPTEDIFLGAHTDAALTAYKNETVLSKLASSARQTVRRGMVNPKVSGLTRVGYRGASVALDITMPFTRIAGAIANVAADYSPAGFLKAVASSMEPNPRLQADVATRLAKASIGTGILLWGMKAAQNGNATGAFPTDAAERRRWDLEGKEPNSVKLDGKWRSITWLGPLSVPFLIGVEIQHAQEKQQTSLGEMVSQGVGFFGRTMTEMSFLQALSNLTDALKQPDKSAASVAARLIPMPTIVPQIAQAIDPKLRAPSDFGERVEARVPGLSKTLPERLNPFGEPMTREGGAGAILDVTGASQATDTPVTRELDRFNLNPGTVQRSVSLDGKKVQRTQEEVNELAQEFGPIKKAVLEEIVTSQEYKEATDDERKEMLEGALRDITATMNDVDKARRSGDNVPKMTPADFLNSASAP